METTTQVLEVVLNSSLTPNTMKTTDVENFNKKLSNENTETVRDVIKGEIRHRNYLSYLAQAWSNHYGVILSPDIVWQIVLCEVAKHVKNNSKNYSHLFTKNPNGKTEIVISTEDLQLIDLNEIVNCLKELVPTDIALFLPKFSTSTVESTFAFNAAFAEAMSPYYNYSMFCCGIPKVKLTGEVEDWKTIIASLEKLSVVLNATQAFQNYLLTVSTLIEEILSNSNNVEFWNEIFYLKKCGSGHQVEVKGWINKLFSENPRVGYIENYLTCISTVPYKNITTGKSFEIVSGLFSSNIDEENYLVPEFGYIINEIKK